MNSTIDKNLSQEILLDVKDLRTWFDLKKWGFIKVGSVKAVDGVNFNLKRGESIAFVGESGCGKSTLARTLLGLYKASQGTVIFNDQDISQFDSAQNKKYRAKVGFVQQDPFAALPPFMDVFTILSEPLIVHGVKKKAERLRLVLKVLEEVRLSPPEDYLNKFPHMLSGGQQQRIVIARALILEPSLIIADEPVSMLDASVRVELLNLLKQIQKSRELALIFITHDLSTVRHYADRIMVMYAGRIVEQSEVNDLLDYPQHPYTISLLSAIADVSSENAKHQRPVPAGEPPNLINPPTGCRFHPRCPKVIAGTCDVKIPPDFQARPSHLSSCWLHAAAKEID